MGLLMWLVVAAWVLLTGADLNAFLLEFIKLPD